MSEQVQAPEVAAEVVDHDEMIDAFVLCWTEVEEHGHSGIKTTVGPYEIIVRRQAEEKP